MGHNVRLFVGPAGALMPFLATAGGRAFALSPGAEMLVLPLTDELHDALHAAYGTGEWLATGPRLSTGDLAFAAAASRGTALVYLETDYFAGEGGQCAVLWRDGTEVLRPTCMGAEAARTRPANLWPINSALRGLGVTATLHDDEFSTLGLAHFRSNEAILEGAVPVLP